MIPLRELTKIYWSAALIYRSARPQTYVRSSLLHVTLNASGRLHAKAAELLKEIIDGTDSSSNAHGPDGSSAS